MSSGQRNTGRKPSKSAFTTKSGNAIKLNRSISGRIKASREAKARRRAAYLTGLPKNRFKRVLYRLHPKRVARYWFSRQGGLMALKIVGIGIVVCFLLMVGVFAYFRKDLPAIKDISGTQLGGSTTYYDRTGQTVLWQDYDAVKRVTVPGDQISPYMKNATIAVEDKNFYKHGAFDIQGIARAGIRDVTKKGGRVEGGSTITQQLVKLNENWTEDRTIARKFKELILAVELEREYSKADILSGYLNIAPYGNIQYGVETASRDYFNKSAKDLTLAESAMLAAIPRSPTLYSPYGARYDSQALIDRQHYILKQMVTQKMVTRAQADEALQENVLAAVRPSIPKYQGIKAPYFVLAAKQELEEKYGDITVNRGGWKVTTTLDTNLQSLAEQQIAKGMTQVRKQGGDTSAFAAIDVQTAQMVALVGGPDFTNPTYGQVNYAKQWLPPGSSFKPYDYVSLINDSTNVGAGSVLYDSQAPIPGYPCTNKARPKDGGNCLTDYDFNYPGPLPIRYALGGSRNVPAVKAMLTVGTNKVVANAEAMGLTSGYKCFSDAAFKKETQCYGSSAIGDGAYMHLDEHVNGYATLSRLGAYIPETYILRIVDAQNKVIHQWKQPQAKQVIKADAAYIIDDILSDPRASYLRADRKFHHFKDWHFGIKTGTTNDAKDGLMMSFSTKYAAGVWVGYHNRERAMTGAMENMTQPVIQGWMDGAHANLKGETWKAPSDLQMLPAYVLSHKISSQSEIVPSPSTDLYPSWFKQTKAGSSSQVTDKVSGKAATDCTPDGAKQTTGNSNANLFSVDIFVGAHAASAGSDDVHNCSDTKPQVTLTAPAGNVCAHVCNFTVTASQGTHPLSSDQFPGLIQLLINGQVVQSQNVSSSPSTLSFSYTPSTAGTYSIEARVTDSVLYSSSDSNPGVSMSP